MVAARLALGLLFHYEFYYNRPSGPAAWIAPICPLLLARILKIFATYPLNAGIAIRCSNILCSGLTCYPLVLLGRELFGNAAGITAG